MKDLLIIGTGSSGEIVKLIEAINRESAEWNILGFTEIREELFGKNFLGYPILGKDDILLSFGDIWIVVNVAEFPEKRLRVFNKLRNIKRDIKFATLVHPSVDVSHSIIEPGVVIFENVSIGVNTIIGFGSFIWKNVVIGHDVKIGKYSVINSGAVINGFVNIGDEVLIGANATIRNGISIGKGTYVSMGSVVHRDIPENVIYMNYIRDVILRKGGREFHE